MTVERLLTVERRDLVTFLFRFEDSLRDFRDAFLYLAIGVGGCGRVLHFAQKVVGGRAVFIGKG